MWSKDVSEAHKRLRMCLLTESATTQNVIFSLGDSSGEVDLFEFSSLVGFSCPGLGWTTREG